MTSPQSITLWIERLRQGDPEAAERLWHRYFRLLVHRARKVLETCPRRAEDEEDVALSAFASFCMAVEHGRFPLLENRDHLWKVLLVVADRKALDHLEKYTRQKRDFRRELDEAEMAGSGSYQGLQAVPDPEPGPELVAEVSDLLRCLLAELPDESYRRVAQLCLEGYSPEEIAHRLGYTVRTAQRKVKLIQEAWQRRADG